MSFFLEFVLFAKINNKSCHMRSTGTRITFYMTLTVLLGFAVILFMNAASFLGVVPSRYISPNDVRGIAVEHNHKLYTLNFVQQNEMIDIFNRAFPVGKEIVDTRKTTIQDPPEVQKIIIYRFNAPDIVITPVAFVFKTTSINQKAGSKDVNMVFSVPEWNPNGLLEESTSDQLHKLLSSTYSL